MYFGNRQSMMGRPDSYVDNYNAPAQQNSGRNRFAQKNHSDPALYGENAFPNHQYRESYDTATTGSGSHNTDQWGNSTDPSSVNSSVDRLPRKQEDSYGFNGIGGGAEFNHPIMEEQRQGQPAYGENGYGRSPYGSNAYGSSNNALGGPPPPPPHKNGANSGSPAPIRLGGDPSNSAIYEAPAVRPGQGDKRKSWFKRRFSKD